jgi:hypothetical protein
MRCCTDCTCIALDTLCCVLCYLQVAAPVTEATRDCSTAHSAVAYGHAGCLASILQDDDEALDDVNERGQPLLHAVNHSDSSMCHSLTAAVLAAIAASDWDDSHLREEVDDAGYTPLQCTIQKQQQQQPAASATAAGAVAQQRICIKCAGQLLQAGAAVHTLECAKSMLELAFAQQSESAACDVTALVKGLCKASELDLSACLRDTVLSMGSDAEARVQLLLRCGADAAQLDDEHEQPLLHVIARGPADSRYSSEQLVTGCCVLRALVQQCKGLPFITDIDQRTALHVAYEYPALMKTLLELGVEVNAEADYEMTALVSTTSKHYYDLSLHNCVTTTRLLLPLLLLLVSLLRSVLCIASSTSLTRA